MDILTQKAWSATLAALNTKDETLRTHFAKLIMALAQCYNDEDPHKAVLILDTGDTLLTYCMGADELEMSEMLKHATEASAAMLMQGAPSKEMFN